VCHLILLLPLLSLPVFWLMPGAVAGEIYAVVLALSLAVYWLAMRAMGKPVCTGSEALAGAIGRVEGAGGRKGTLRLRGELWQYLSGAVLSSGDTVEVVGREGLRLRVRPVEHHGPAPSADRQPGQDRARPAV